jgi:hypothetical protein
MEKPDYRHARLLRMCREWPHRSSTANHFDEIAPSHLLFSIRVLHSITPR